MKKIFIRILFLSVFMMGVSFAQEIRVYGVVKSSVDTIPLMGATVFVKDESIGVQTDFDGLYEITVPKGSIVVYSYVGMNSREVLMESSAIADLGVVIDKEVNMTLTPSEDSKLDEIVVTGYQDIKKEFFIGASGNVKMEDAKLDGLPDVSRMLEGRVAGINVQNVTGTFGSAPRITIRGSSSILGDSKPIWVVDGAIQEEIVSLSLSDLVSGDTNTLLSSAISGLNASDILSVEVLKDASATALYGARALNGVIVITTKSGKLNSKNKINYTSEFSTRPIPSYTNHNVLNSQESMAIFREMESKGHLNLEDLLQGRNGGVYALMYRAINTFDESTGKFKLANTPEAKADFLRRYELVNTDWFKTLFKMNVTQTHSLSSVGGGESSTQYASLSYYTDSGWSIADKVDRITGNIRNVYYLGKEDKLKATVLLRGSHRVQKAPGSLSRKSDPFHGSSARDFDLNPYSYALQTTRTLPVYDQNRGLEYYRMNYAPFNIINELRNNVSDIDVLDLKFQGELEYKIMDNLKFNFLGTVRYAKSTSEHRVNEHSNFVKAYKANSTTIEQDSNQYLYTDMDKPDGIPIIVLPKGGILNTRKNLLTTYTLRNTLDYDFEIDDIHSVRLYGGQEIRYTDRKNAFSQGYGIQYSKGNSVFTEPLMFKKLGQNSTNYFGMSNFRLRAATFFLSATYSFDGKYVLNLTGNYEGSNRAGKSAATRWLPTYNIGGKWNAHKEDFIRDISVISSLSVRTSYGLSALIAGVVSNNLPVFENDVTNRLLQKDRENVVKIKNLQNKNLTWEKNLEFNLGVDLGLLDNRISLTTDFYSRRGIDLIDRITTSGVGGEMYKYANNSNMTTQGIEFALTTKNIKVEDFSWSTTFNMAYFYQEITSLQQKPDAFNLVSGVGGNIIGKPRGSLFSYRFSELDDRGLPIIDFIDPEKNKDYISSINFQDTEDVIKYLKYEGPIEPNLTGGMSNNFKYKNWNFSFFITYSFGNKIRLNNPTSFDSKDLTTFQKEIKNRWLIPGDEAKTTFPVIPSKRLENKIGKTNMTQLYNAYGFSTERIADGGFVRMKNISLSYSLNSDMLTALKLSSLKLSLQATNPFLIYSDSKLNGQDPEFFRTGGVSLPMTTSYTISLNIGI